MDILQAKNILGQINLAASEGVNGSRDAKSSCELIQRLTNDMAKALDFQQATVETVDPQTAPVTDQQQA